MEKNDSRQMIAHKSEQFSGTDEDIKLIKPYALNVL